MSDRSAAAPVRIYFGHHKCMTSWIGRILGRVCAEMGWRFVGVFETKLSGLDPVAGVERVRQAELCADGGPGVTGVELAAGREPGDGLAGDVRPEPDASGTEIDDARISFGVGNELWKGFGGE